MTIENFDALFEKVMNKLESMPPEEFKRRVDAHGVGTLDDTEQRRWVFDQKRKARMEKVRLNAAGLLHWNSAT